MSLKKSFSAGSYGTPNDGRPTVNVQPNKGLLDAVGSDKDKTPIGGGITLPPLTGELPPKGIEGEMAILAHEMAHALLGLTDYFDPKKLMREAERAIKRLNGGDIPEFGTASPGN